MKTITDAELPLFKEAKEYLMDKYDEVLIVLSAKSKDCGFSEDEGLKLMESLKEKGWKWGGTLEDPVLGYPRNKIKILSIRLYTDGIRYGMYPIGNHEQVVFYSPDSTAEKVKLYDNCPSCGVLGEWVSLVLRCPKCFKKLG